MFSPIADCLYDYVMETHLDGRFTAGIEEYVSSLFYAERVLEHLNELLDEPARKELEKYVGLRDTVDYYNRKALFSAGLSVALALSRLG